LQTGNNKNTDEEENPHREVCVALVNISERFSPWFCLPVDYSWTVYSSYKRRTNSRIAAEICVTVKDGVY